MDESEFPGLLKDLVEEPDGPVETFGGKLPHFIVGPQVGIIDADVGDRPGPELALFVRRQPELKGLGDRTGDLLLNGEYVFEAPAYFSAQI